MWEGCGKFGVGGDEDVDEDDLSIPLLPFGFEGDTVLSSRWRCGMEFKATGVVLRKGHRYARALSPRGLRSAGPHMLWARGSGNGIGNGAYLMYV